MTIAAAEPSKIELRFCNAQRRWDPFDAMSLLASCFPCFDCCTAALRVHTCLSGVSIWLGRIQRLLHLLAMCANTLDLASWQRVCKQTAQTTVADHVDVLVC